jgi:hypothetical protein
MQPDFLDPDKFRYSGFIASHNVRLTYIKLRNVMKNMSVTYVYKAIQTFRAHPFSVVQKPNFNCDTKCIEAQGMDPGPLQSGIAASTTLPTVTPNGQKLSVLN